MYLYFLERKRKSLFVLHYLIIQFSTMILLQSFFFIIRLAQTLFYLDLKTLDSLNNTL